MIKSKVIPAEVLEAGVDSFMIIGMWPEGGVYLSFRLADPIRSSLYGIDPHRDCKQPVFFT